jgi:cytochrome c oxidase assembly factor CtaG
MVNSAFARPGLTPASLRIVRYAMLALLLLFGAFAYYQSIHRTPDPESTTDLSLLQWVGYGLCALTIVGVAVIRQVRERASEAARPTLGMVGSALAEGAAMFGAVFMVLGGGIGVYALGLVLFLATWTLLPADSETA